MLFTDVPANAWYYHAVMYVYENKLMSGTGNNNFAPNAPTNRAMMVTICDCLFVRRDIIGGKHEAENII